MTKEEIGEIFADYLLQSGMWDDFKWVIEKEGHTLDELGMNTPGIQELLQVLHDEENEFGQQETGPSMSEEDIKDMIKHPPDLPENEA